MRFYFVVDGPPVGWQRAGENQITGWHFTQPKTAYQEARVAYAYRGIAHGFRFPAKTPLILIVTAYLPIPASASKKRKQQMADNEILPTVKPDADNVWKLCADALDGVAFDNDKDIFFSQCVKLYSDRPRTEILLSDERETINGWR